MSPVDGNDLGSLAQKAEDAIIIMDEDTNGFQRDIHWQKRDPVLNLAESNSQSHQKPRKRFSIAGTEEMDLTCLLPRRCSTA